MHTYIPIHTYTYTYTYTHPHTHKHPHTQTPPHTHTPHTHTPTHTYTHTRGGYGWDDLGPFFPEALSLHNASVLFPNIDRWNESDLSQATLTSWTNGW